MNDEDITKDRLFELLDVAPTFEAQNAFAKSYSILNKAYKNISVSISGGSDSDVLIDFVERVRGGKDGVCYVFFDTGMEFQATKDQLSALEEKYGVTIHRERAVVPVPLGVRKYGQPFLSKQVSEFISRLQRQQFKWEDRPFLELYAEYPNCKAALRWWCNDFGEGSKFNIASDRWLKEFMVENPPKFLISPKCCEGAKKKTAKRFESSCGADLTVIGVRKAEGGARSTAYKNCFSKNENKIDQLRPLFWFSKADKAAYCETFGVTHSRCYTQYNLPGTGCACCPFGSNFENELKAAEEYEPKLYKAALKVFADSYEYTREYRRFKAERDRTL